MKIDGGWRCIPDSSWRPRLRRRSYRLDWSAAMGEPLVPALRGWPVEREGR